MVSLLVKSITVYDKVEVTLSRPFLSGRFTTDLNCEIKTLK